MDLSERESLIDAKLKTKESFSTSPEDVLRTPRTALSVSIHVPNDSSQSRGDVPTPYPSFNNITPRSSSSDYDRLSKGYSFSADYPQRSSSPPNDLPRPPSSGTDRLLMSPASNTDYLPRPPSCANDHFPKSPVSTTDFLPRPPSCANDRLPRSPVSTTDFSPRLPSCANDFLPRSPISKTQLLPRPPSSAVDFPMRSPTSATRHVPRPPSPIAGDVLPRKVSKRASGIRRYNIRPASKTYNTITNIEGNSRPNSPNIPKETDRMGLGGNTDSLIAFYENGSRPTSSYVDDMSRPTSGSSSNASIPSSSPSMGIRTRVDDVAIEACKVKQMRSAESTDQQELDKDDNIDILDGNVISASKKPKAIYPIDEKGSEISDIEFDSEVVGQKISLAADDTQSVEELKSDNDPSKAEVDTDEKEDLDNKDTKLISESNKAQDKDVQELNVAYDKEEESLVACSSDLENSAGDGASVSLSAEGQEWDARSIDVESKSISEGSSSIELDRDIAARTDKVLNDEDISKMPQAPEGLIVSWKNLIETNLRTLAMLKSQKLESDEIHESYCQEYERLRGDVIRLHEDNGRKRYLADDIRLKYPGMFDEVDEIRPMNEIMDQHIRNREDEIEMELNMASIYHQFLQDKLLIERSIGLECIGHPLKAFVDRYNELKFAKQQEEKQKLNLTDAFPMPDLMRRIDKSKSGKYPVFKILKDGQHFVMTNNGLISAMQRHKEMIKEEQEEEEDLMEEESADSISDTASEDQGHKYDSDSASGEESFFKKLDEIMNKFSETNENIVKPEKEDTIERTQGKIKLGTKAINLILHEGEKEAKPDISYCSYGISEQVLDNELSDTQTADLDARGRRRTKAEEKLAYSKRRNNLDDVDKNMHDIKSRLIKRVQTPRGISTKAQIDTGYKALPPVIADGKHIRMADTNTALQKNMISNRQGIDNFEGLKIREKENVGDFKGLQRFTKHNTQYADEMKESVRSMTEQGKSGLVDLRTDSHKNKLDSSEKIYKSDKRMQGLRVTKHQVFQETPLSMENRKEVMGVDNHSYIRKPHPPTSNICPVPKSLPVISKGSMTTIKTSSSIGVQLNGQCPSNMHGIWPNGRIGSAGRRRKIDANNVSVILRPRRKE